MKISVLIEPVAENGYRARGGSPFDLSADGATREEALPRLRDLIAEKIEHGASIAHLEFDDSQNPWLHMAGIWDTDDPLVEAWKHAMADNRRKADKGLKAS